MLKFLYLEVFRRSEDIRTKHQNAKVKLIS